MTKPRLPELLLPVGIIACLLLIFMPLPTVIMDILLAANIAVAVMILLTTIYVGRPLELSIFPSLLLATTLARLALNVATTRLILTRGAIEHEAAAGGVIQGFSSFVTGDSLAVGLVIFCIIVVIQFVVITKGATRISEVAARFSLDGMPGRQMAIDADLNAGVIDSNQAMLRREEVFAEADFYGAMDGASKFVRGDAVAGVIITLINIVGGLAIGLSSNMSIQASAQTFTSLTIGDGLVSQLPALLISLAAGVLVTRSTRHTNLPSQAVEQVFSRPIVLVITAAFLGILVLTDLPAIPLLVLAAGCLVGAWKLNQRPAASQSNTAISNSPASSNNQAGTQSNSATAKQDFTIESLLTGDVVELELGLGLLRLADSKQGGNLLPLVTETRKQLATELGVILPKVKVRDNLLLESGGFRILVQGNTVEKAEIDPANLLAIDDGLATEPLDARSIVAMASKTISEQPAYWISADARSSAKALGYRIQSADMVVATQLKKSAKRHAVDLLTRDATVELIDQTKKTSPAVVEELIPTLLSVGKVQQILKALLGEGVSIRPMAQILEAIGDHIETTPNHWNLVEKVRIRLARSITASLSGHRNAPIPAFTIAPDLQDRIACGWERDGNEIRLDLPRSMVESLARSIASATASLQTSGNRPVLLVDQCIRPVLAEIADGVEGDLFVLGHEELAGNDIEQLGEITIEQVSSMSAAA
ncbi:flagellar biosynthesis protein FlhA [Mariniblastus sp.]|nr:flagellar biosynthesis protein FlhA [Mariniblastus sp.]